MIVTNPQFLAKAIRSETTFVTRIEMSLCTIAWGLESTERQYQCTVRRIRADYKRRVQKKGRKIAA